MMSDYGFSMEMKEITGIIGDCSLCSLSTTRTRAVPGEGPDNSRVIFIGEAPGRDEDIKGRPFVGRSGKLLTRLLDDSGLGRKNVFITSILKCRPPENRQPKKGEVKACYPYLEKQLKILNPHVIVPLGNTAIKALLGLTGISRLRGTTIKENGFVYFPMYHPAAGIRNGNLIPDMKRDMSALVKILNSVEKEG